MTKAQFAVMLLAGFAGGATSHLLMPSAQAQAPASAEVRAQRIVLVDQSGALAGMFASRRAGAPDAPPVIVLFDRTGREIWRAPGGLFPVPVRPD
jgi:hypothetical protein